MFAFPHPRLQPTPFIGSTGVPVLERSGSGALLTAEDDNVTTDGSLSEYISSIVRFDAAAVEEPVRLEVLTADSVRVLAGTKQQLVVWLTHEEWADNTFIRAFLLTYETFYEPIVLLRTLIARFCDPNPASPVPPVRLCCCGW